MNPPIRFRPRQPGTSGFTLIESVVAIGIFAFVIVGILGLFPAAMQRQADAAAESRARIIAESIFEGIKASDTLDNAKLPPAVDTKKDEPFLARENYIQGIVIGYSQDGTAVNYIWRNDPSAWEGDFVPDNQNITIKARVKAEKLSSDPEFSDASEDLYRVTVTVGSPAYVPASARTIFPFTSYIFSPPLPPNAN